MDKPALSPSTDPTLVQMILKGLNKTSGWNAVNNTIGLGKHLVTKGLPDKVRTSPEGRLQLYDKDATDPETIGDVMSLPMDATPLELQHEERHGDQEDVIGPGMIFMRSAEQLYPYGKGPLEADTFKRTESGNPISNQGKQDLYQRLIEMYLKNTLGAK